MPREQGFRLVDQLENHPGSRDRAVLRDVRRNAVEVGFSEPCPPQPQAFSPISFSDGHGR